MAAMLAPAGYARKREADAKRGFHRPRDGARYLGSASQAASMRDRHLEDTQPCPRGAHLHLEVPAVSHLAQAEPLERLVTDGAKGAHVGVGNAVEQTSQCAGTVACHDLQRVHAAGLTLAACTRADHEVVCAAEDRAEQQRRELRPVAAIAVEEYDDVAVTRRPGPRCAGPAIAA